jgi:hypothetical protein
MKALLSLLLVLWTERLALSQGTFIYDQQSSVEGSYKEGLAYIQQSQPMGQSFTPSLSAVGFVRLYMNNGLSGNTSAATVYVNLRTNSTSGPILAQSLPVTIPGGSLFVSTVDFVFANGVTVSPNATYFFQPVVQDNDNIGVSMGQYGYLGGDVIIRGAANTSLDFWFREGLYIVPEPSAAALLGLSGVALFCRARKRRRESLHTRI